MLEFGELRDSCLAVVSPAFGSLRGVPRLCRAMRRGVDHLDGLSFHTGISVWRGHDVGAPGQSPAARIALEVGWRRQTIGGESPTGATGLQDPCTGASVR
jgi:hypothetical protein